jgi:hypothetical protein
MKLATAMSKVRALAELIRDYWERELPKRHPHYPLVYDGEDDGPPPPEEKKLRQLLARLPGETLYKIALIMNVGGHAVPVSDLGGGYQQLQEEFENPSDLASFLTVRAQLADDLEEGVEMLESQHIDLDKLDKMDLDTARERK